MKNYAKLYTDARKELRQERYMRQKAEKQLIENQNLLDRAMESISSYGEFRNFYVSLGENMRTEIANIKMQIVKEMQHIWLKLDKK